MSFKVIWMTAHFQDISPPKTENMKRRSKQQGPWDQLLKDLGRESFGLWPSSGIQDRVLFPREWKQEPWPRWWRPEKTRKGQVCGEALGRQTRDWTMVTRLKSGSTSWSPGLPSACVLLKATDYLVTLAWSANQSNKAIAFDSGMYQISLSLTLLFFLSLHTWELQLRISTSIPFLDNSFKLLFKA